MIKKLLEKVYKLFDLDVDNEEDRTHIQYILVLSVLALVSFFMVGVNVITKWYKLGRIVGYLGVGCVINDVLELKLKNKFIGRFLFAAEIVVSFSYFLIIGEPEGFSCLWILLLPACGFFLFGMKYGTVVGVAQFLILVFYLWIPFGNTFLQYPYTSTFKQRFPIVYIAFSLVGILLELTRLNAQKQISQQKEQFEYLYNHDSLTGLYNRYGFNKSLDDYLHERNGEPFAFAILDLDKFKSVNDKYGHLNGDKVLKSTAEHTFDYFGKDCVVCRWGGEEFSILIKNCEDPQAKCWGLLSSARTRDIELDKDTKIKAVFSMGVILVGENCDVKVNELVRQADNNLYTAKETGRNRIVCGDYVEVNFENDDVLTNYQCGTN